MKLKRNSLTTLLVVSFLLMALSGCGQQAEPDSAQPPLETVTYSNLTDADTRKLLTEALADANVDETRTKLLLDRVDQFNASVKSEWLTGGFESAAPTETRYDPYEMQDLWMEKNGSFPGYNCRITAFSLFGELVTAGADQPETQGEDSLFMDLETLAADPAVLCGDSTSKFCALFAPVTAADTTEAADQVKALQAGWSERGISFEDSSARLISVVLHDRFSDTDNTLFIGHVGVLLPAEDGSLYFIEKVAFQEPYRLVKIQNRTELSDYLMEKYDTAWGQDTTRSFIMENDELMDGYRPNPLDSASYAAHRAGSLLLRRRFGRQGVFRLCAVSSLPRSGYSQKVYRCGIAAVRSPVYNKCRAHSCVSSRLLNDSDKGVPVCQPTTCPLPPPAVFPSAPRHFTFSPWC